MTLKTVMETLAGKTSPVTYDDLPALFDQVRNILFPNFPIYDETHRTPLQNLIMGRFLTREICMTPYARWQFAFNQKLMEIMPVMNKLYVSMEDINLFDDVNYSRTINTDGTKTMEKGTTDTTEAHVDTTVTGSFMPGVTNVTTTSTTPQTNLESFLNDRYVSSADKSTASGEDTSVNTTTSGNSGSIVRSGQDKDVEQQKVIETVKGKRGGKTYAELVTEYKDTIFSVDNMILDSLEELFFMVY